MVIKRISKFFSTSIPIIDVQPFLRKQNYLLECQKVAKALHQYGCLIIKDPRINQSENSRFLDMMEKFFESRGKAYYNGNFIDIFPEASYQIGVTPEFKEQAKCHKQFIRKLQDRNKAITPQPPGFDAKWRYLWRIGELDEWEKNIKHHHQPSDFPEWKNNMSRWGNHMIDGCFTVAQMAAIGLGLDKNIFLSRLQRGAHLLAPTGSDLLRYKVGTVFAGFHYDFNFLTIHGKSRFPGLFVWLRNNQRISVSIPQGYLLLQAGKQFEFVTGGYVTSGFHEVIFTEEVEKAKDQAVKYGRIPWRVSSTLFCTMRRDVILQPLDRFATEDAKNIYKPMTVQQQVDMELKQIKLAS